MAVRRFLVTVAATVLLLPLLGWASSAAPAGPARAAARVPLVTLGSPPAPFSPNRDGRRDTVRIGFDLGRSARVVVRVRGEDGAVSGPHRLGLLRAGRHAWRWNGRGDNGRVVDDGSYTVHLVVRRGHRIVRVRQAVEVDTTLERGTLVTTRPTVYPSATVVSDQVELAYLQRGWNEAWDLLLPSLFRTDLVITDARGHVVRRRSLDDVAMPVFDWFAVGNAGAPLPAGEYLARVTVQDEAGNRQVLEQPLTVSHQQLAEETWTGATTAAREVGSYAPFYGGCNGCAACAPVDSRRFDGGLSFPPCDIEFASTTGRFAADVPFDAAPVDAFRITATGGPAEPGSPDTGNLNGTPTATGDSATTTPWQPVRLSAYPNLPRQDRPVSWWFSTPGGSSYDVATFTVEYRRYAPAP